jgi:hypothetical protein
LREGRENSLNSSLLSNHVEVNILLICKCLVNFFLFMRLLKSLFLISYVGILHVSGGNLRLLFIIIPLSGVCMFIVLCSVFLNWVCWVRENFSGEPGLVYIPCMCLRCVERRAGTSIFGHLVV